MSRASCACSSWASGRLALDLERVAAWLLTLKGKGDDETGSERADVQHAATQRDCHANAFTRGAPTTRRRSFC
jgi:hypothetical protein